MGDVVMPAARQALFSISFQRGQEADATDRSSASVQLMFKRHDEVEAGLVTSTEGAAIRHLEAELLVQAVQEWPDVIDHVTCPGPRGAESRRGARLATSRSSPSHTWPTSGSGSTWAT